MHSNNDTNTHQADEKLRDTIGCIDTSSGEIYCIDASNEESADIVNSYIKCLEAVRIIKRTRRPTVKLEHIREHLNQEEQCMLICMIKARHYYTTTNMRTGHMPPIFKCVNDDNYNHDPTYDDMWLHNSRDMLVKIGHFMSKSTTEEEHSEFYLATPTHLRATMTNLMFKNKSVNSLGIDAAFFIKNMPYTHPWRYEYTQFIPNLHFIEYTRPKEIKSLDELKNLMKEGEENDDPYIITIKYNGNRALIVQYEDAVIRMNRNGPILHLTTEWLTNRRHESVMIKHKSKNICNKSEEYLSSDIKLPESKLLYVFDAEMCAIDDQGFASSTSVASIGRGRKRIEGVAFIFDILYSHEVADVHLLPRIERAAVIENMGIPILPTKYADQAELYSTIANDLRALWFIPPIKIPSRRLKSYTRIVIGRGDEGIVVGRENDPVIGLCSDINDAYRHLSLHKKTWYKLKPEKEQYDVLVWSGRYGLKGKMKGKLASLNIAMWDPQTEDYVSIGAVTSLDEPTRIKLTKIKVEERPDWLCSISYTFSRTIKKKQDVSGKKRGAGKNSERGVGNTKKGAGKKKEQRNITKNYKTKKCKADFYFSERMIVEVNAESVQFKPTVYLRHPVIKRIRSSDDGQVNDIGRLFA